MGEAYAVLSDQSKKQRYDNGEDLDDPMGGMRGNYTCFPRYIDFIDLLQMLYRWDGKFVCPKIKYM